MKRVIAMLVTFAMVGSLTFMGFAGTAAAQDADIGSDVDVGQDAASAAEVNTAQQNNNAQAQIAESHSSSDTSYAKTNAAQQQTVGQQNNNDVGDVTSIASNNAETDAGTDLEFDLNVSDLGEEPVDNETDVPVDEEPVDNETDVPVDEEPVDNETNVPVDEEPVDNETNVPVDEELEA